MWKPNITVIIDHCMMYIYIITDLVQMIFSTQFRYFEFVGYLLCGMMLIVFSVSIWLHSTTIGLPDHGESSSEKISRTKPHKALLTHSVSDSSFSMYHTILSLHFSCIFTFLKIIKHNMLKMLIFFSSSVLKWLYKNSTIFLFFKMHSDMTAVTIQSKSCFK